MPIYQSGKIMLEKNLSTNHTTQEHKFSAFIIFFV